MSFTQDSNGIWLFNGTPISANGQKLQANMQALSQLKAALARTEFPSLIATGAGTEGSPYTHADGNGGIQTKIDILAADRGGLVSIQGRTNVTTPALIESLGGITIRGTAVGFMQDASTIGADGEGLNRGTKLKCTAAVDAVRVGKAGTTTGNRPTGIAVEDVYLDGYSGAAPTASPETGTAGVRCMGDIDHFAIRNCNLRNFTFGILTPGANNFDAILIDNVEIVKCCRPIVLTSTFGKIINSQLDGNNWGAIIGGYGVQFIGNTMLSNLQRPSSDGGSYNPTLYSLEFLSEYGTLANNTIIGLGYNDNTKNYGGTVRFAANNSTCTGNLLANHPARFLLEISGDSNVVSGNSKVGSYTEKNIWVKSGADDNVINQPGCTITDDGARTIFNGVSKNAGDPNSTGDWSGVAKSDGLFIYDTVGTTMYLYHSLLSGGRKTV
jgi:hypothetical protein